LERKINVVHANKISDQKIANMKYLLTQLKKQTTHSMQEAEAREIMSNWAT
jgi:hypothetical protein